MQAWSQKSVRVYTVATLSVLTAGVLRHSLHPWLGDNAPFVLFYLVILIVGWYGGLGPAVYTTGLSLVIASTRINPFAAILSSPSAMSSATTLLALQPSGGAASATLNIVVALGLTLFARFMDLSRSRALRIAQLAVENETNLKKSEQRLTLALDAGSMAYWEWDLRLHRCSGSIGFESILGVERGQLDGRIESFLNLVDPRDRASFQTKITHAISQRSDHSFEFRIRSKTKGLQWFESRGRVMFDENQDPIRMIGIIANISARKDSEVSKSHLSAIVESSADAIVAEDLEGFITSWNDGARRVFGFTVEEALGRTPSTLLHTENSGDQSNQMIRVRSGELLHNLEISALHKDGHRIWTSVSAAPLRDEKGMTIGVSKIYRDITATRTYRERESLLHRVSSMLSVSLDFDEALRQLAPLLTHSLCDLCIIDIYDGSHKNWRRLAESHWDGEIPDPELVTALAREWQKDESLPRSPLFIPNLNGDLKDLKIPQSHPNTPQKDQAKGSRMTGPHSITSVAIVPLAAHNKIYGTLALARTKISYQDDDLRFFCELSRHIALSIDNARLFAEAQAALTKYQAEIKERSRVEAELRRSERLYRAIDESIDYGVWTADPKGRINYVSDALLHKIGKSAADWADQANWGDVLPKDEAKRVAHTWRRCVKRGTMWDEELMLRGKNGTLVPILSRAKPVYDEKGQITAWAGISIDISRLKKAEAELIRAKEAADAANAAKSAFLANMSHEIRTPLSAIVGFSEILATSDASAPERDEYAAIIKRNGALLSGIISDILDLSKIEAGHLTVEKVPVDLLDLLRDVKNGLGFLAQEKNLSLDLYTTPDLPPFVKTDPIRLKQILINIIGNAIKFTNQGQVKVRVCRVARDLGDQLMVTVRDTGCGIPPEKVHHLFTPFSQADASTTRRYGGTGLGLALSRQLAHLLGGDVRLLHSRRGLGSLFEIVIDAGPSLDGIGTTKPPEVVAPFVLEGSLNGWRILLVEDSPDNRLLIKTILKKAGAIVTTADNGLQGVTRALAENPDLILMDVQMPIMDGYRAAQVLREKGFNRPILALSAHAFTDEKAKCLKQGFDDHISKPVTTRGIVKAVRCYPPALQLPAPKRV